MALFSSTTHAQKTSAQGITPQNVSSIEEAIAVIDSKLPILPRITGEDFGGSRGALIYTLAEEVEQSEPLIEINIEWEGERAIDLITLIPSRSYDLSGLELQHLMPRQYDLQLLDSQGSPVGDLIREDDAWAEPHSKGYPFLYPLKAQQLANSLRIRIYSLAPNADKLREPRAALAEVLCFEDQYNVALGAKVSASRGQWLETWKWNRRFLIDGVTGMGFPEKRIDAKPSHKKRRFDIGWISNGHLKADSEGWVELDLGRSQWVDGLRLFPAIRPSVGHVPGIGMPRRFRVYTSETGEPGDWDIWIDHQKDAVPESGQHPAEFRSVSRSARFIRLEASQFWKVSPYYPAYIGFSEIQVLQQDQNVALGADVEVFERVRPRRAEANFVWAPSGLVDGNSISAEILPIRDWLELLFQRQTLEKQRQIQLEALNRTKEARQKLILWSAVGISASGFVVAAFFFWRARLRVRHYQRDLKLRLAGDLHDDLGSNLGCILSLSRAIETNPRNAESNARRIYQTTSESLESIRDLVQTFRGEPMAKGEVVQRIHATAERMLPSMEVSFKAAPELDEFVLNPTDRRNLLLFVREALHNCLKHSGASQVSIQMHLEGNDCILEISDNGCGIPQDLLAKDYTLLALKARCRQLHGVLDFESEENQGFRLTLRLPAKHSKNQSL